ncbi:MAG: hypothetical protein ACI308_02155, partial [Muribaculaceae bacterium]
AKKIPFSVVRSTGACEAPVERGLPLRWRVDFGRCTSYWNLSFKIFAIFLGDLFAKCSKYINFAADN